MNQQEAAQINKEILKKITPSVQVDRQDSEVEGSAIKIERLGKNIEMAIAKASEEKQSTS